MEEVNNIIIGFGLEFKKIEKIQITYSVNKDSMSQRIYKYIFFNDIKKK